MDRVKAATVADARQFFEGELRQVLQKHRVDAGEESVDYLVELLLRYMESKNFFVQNEEGKLEDNFLVDLYSEYIVADTQKKRLVLQRLGDVCLLVSGFFAESVTRKLTDLQYYFGMGGSAYQQLSLLQNTSRSRKLYLELSKKFRPFSNALGEMSERTGVQSNKDILRLYERWVVTGSERLREKLSEHGIKTPIANKNRH